VRRFSFRSLDVFAAFLETFQRWAELLMKRLLDLAVVFSFFFHLSPFVCHIIPLCNSHLLGWRRPKRSWFGPPSPLVGRRIKSATHRAKKPTTPLFPPPSLISYSQMAFLETPICFTQVSTGPLFPFSGMCHPP